MTDKDQPEVKKSPAQQERDLEKALEESFPASDPPAATQPGSGIHKHKDEEIKEAETH